MKKIIIATTALALMCGSALAETSNMSGSTGMSNPMNSNAMMKKHRKHMKKRMMKSNMDNGINGGMNNGMNNGMNGGMNNGMNNGMNGGGMSRGNGM